mmetsp:Transcript_491/g.1554  ORF Transcript_491/g.1554 Transcript_491/m.1554 type:complete len:394 (-) Transcript_491:46-1227(-)
MGQTRRARDDVARRVHVRVAGREEVVDQDAAFARLHARCVEAEIAGVWLSARRHEQRVALQRPALLAAAVALPRRLAAAPSSHSVEGDARESVRLRRSVRHPLDSRVVAHGHASLTQRGRHRLPRLGVFPRQQPPRPRQHGDCRSEGGEGMRHLQCHSAGAEDGESGRQRVEVEQVGVGEERRGLQPGYGRQRGAPSCCDDCLPEAEDLAVHLDSVAAGEAASPLVHVGARRVGALVRVGGSDLRPLRPQPLHHRRKVDRRRRREPHSKLLCSAHLPHGARGAEQRLGGHAADIEAVAAGERLRDQAGASAAPRRLLGRHEPARARANDDKVVHFGRRRVRPASRVDRVEQPGIARVERFNLELPGRACVGVGTRIPASNGGDRRCADARVGG